MAYEKYLEFTCSCGKVHKGRIIIDGVSAGLEATGAPAGEKFEPIDITTAPNYTIRAKDLPAGRPFWASRDDAELGVKRGEIVSDPATMAAYRAKWPHVMCGVAD